MVPRVRRGDRVTAQLQYDWSGAPVPNWPNPQYIGTVKEVVKIAGPTYARIKFDSGRIDLENLDRLTVLTNGA